MLVHLGGVCVAGCHSVLSRRPLSARQINIAHRAKRDWQEGHRRKQVAVGVGTNTYDTDAEDTVEFTLVIHLDSSGIMRRRKVRSRSVMPV